MIEERCSLEMLAVKRLNSKSTSSDFCFKKKSPFHNNLQTFTNEFNRKNGEKIVKNINVLLNE